MALVKHEYPILEYSTQRNAVTFRENEGTDSLPPFCVMTFFAEVLSPFVEKWNGRQVSEYISEMRRFPIYELCYRGQRICVTQAAVGGSSIAMQTEGLIREGARTIFACGCCGVLGDIPAGDVILPVAALRDEGASYHYLPPSRTIALDAAPLGAIRRTLKRNGVPSVEGMTWTTDGFCRETAEMVAYRKSEGCIAVEMECATLAAIARFRGTQFGQLLYSGDILADPEHYDERDWGCNTSAREKLFGLTLESLLTLIEEEDEGHD